MTRAVRAVDLFCGAGGTSRGLALACQELGKRVDLTAINHWKIAIESHAANHPWAKHVCANVESLDPREVVPRRHLNILVASPECVGYSCAAGGRPKNDQKRASAWHILRWLELLKVDSILVENVREFKDWGPLNSRGFEIKARKGEIYRAWLSAIRSFGYNVDTRVLNAADYGAPTSRSRLFIAARKGNAPINWPEPTHSKTGTGKRKWHPAREIIDWSLKGQSIFTRKKPLSMRTVARIIEGLKRFGGRELQPFIVLMEHGGGIKSLEDPLPTITTAKGGSMALAEPSFVLSQASGGAPRSVEDPLPTIPAGGAHALIESFVLSQGSKEPCLLQYNGNSGAHSVNEPLPTIPTHDRFALVQPEVNGRVLDVRFRMLQPHELASAMGFPSKYKLHGTKTEAVRQIGNAVVVQVSKALCKSLLSEPRQGLEAV